MTVRGTTVPARQQVAELMAQLLWGPKTVRELVAAVGADAATISHWLRELRAAGVVHVSGYRRTGARPARVWALQTRPFAEADAPMPPHPIKVSP